MGGREFPVDEKKEIDEVMRVILCLGLIVLEEWGLSIAIYILMWWS